MRFFHRCIGLGNPGGNRSRDTPEPCTLSDSVLIDIVGSTRFYELWGDIAGRQMVRAHNDLLFPIIAGLAGVSSRRSAIPSWPHLLDRADRRPEDLVGGPVLSSVREVFREESSPHFEFILEPLQAVIRVRPSSPSDEHHLRSVVKQGFLVEGETGLVSYSPALTVFLRKSLTPSMMKGRC
jgi:hypothetical protein